MVIEVKLKNQSILEQDLQESERIRQELESQCINLKEKAATLKTIRMDFKESERIRLQLESENTDLKEKIYQFKQI
jgi:hypothetical protein